jgi:hypothetical protein
LLYYFQVIFGGMTEIFLPSSDSVILNRYINSSKTSVDGQPRETWEWQTALSNDDKLQQMTSSMSINSPHIAIADRVDRLYCLLELMDPAAAHLPLIERLNVNNASERNKNKKQPYVIGESKPALSLVERISEASRINSSLNIHQKKSTQPRMLGKLLEFVFSESQKWGQLYAMNSASGESSPPDDGGSTTMSFFQNILILIFLQYPSNETSLSLTPWDIADMLSTSAATHKDANYVIDSKQGFVNLMMDLRFLCAKYAITLDDFERFFSFLLLTPVSKAGLSSSVSYKLSIGKLEQFFPYLLDLFSSTNLKLLQDGFPLILWGYLSCTRGNGGHSSSQQWYMSDASGKDIIDYELFDLQKKLPKKYDFAKVNPLLEDVTAIFPSRGLYLAKKEYGMITLNAARNWALLQEIESEICDYCFRLCVDITGDSVLHFSNFLIFGVLCFYRQLNETNGQQNNSSYLSTGQATSILLKSLSFNIHIHQQISTKKTLASIILGASAMNMTCAEHVLHLSAEVFQQLQSLGKERCKKRGLGDSLITQQLPPRPPVKLWDAPRFIGFCKAMGVLSSVGSLSTTWRLFGPVLLAAYPAASTQGWGGDVVGPLPVQVTVAKISELLSGVPLSRQGEQASEEKTENLFILVQQVIAPFLAGFFDDLISAALLEERKKQRPKDTFLTTYSTYGSILTSMESDSSTTGNGSRFRTVGIDESSLLLEDMLRYGGDRTVASLHYLSPWVLQVFNSLRPSRSSLADSKLEPFSLTLSQYLASSKLLSSPTVSVLIKQTMSPRTRALQFQSNGSFLSSDIGISLPEFEEIIIRCAFAFWCDVGALSMTMSETVAESHVNKIIIQIFDNMTSKYQDLSTTLVGKYCEECRYAFYQNHQKKNFSLQKRPSGSTFQASFRDASKGSKGNTEGHRSWGIDFLTPFCALLHETASPPASSAALTVPPTPAQLLNESPRLKALQREVPPVNAVIDFQERAEQEKESNNVANMLESWGHDPAARNESKTFDATKGQSQTVNNSSDNPHKPTVNVHMENIFSIKGTSSGSVDGSEGFQVISSASLRESMSPPRRPPVVSSPSPHSIVSRSEEMLAHILAMRGSTPTVESSGDQAAGSPLKDPVSSPQQQSHLQATQPVTSPSQIHDMPSEGIDMAPNHSENTLEISTSPFLPTPFTFSSTSSSPSPNVANNDELLEGTKEALWPVFATYCSCGDSSEPGKLSGPNLFALLSKLDLLTDDTMISDLGVLLHQISAHSLSQTPSSMLSSTSHGGVVEAEQSPLLSFEEFIVFLCAFSQLRFEGVVKLPSWSLSPSKSTTKGSTKKEENWFAMCNTMYMSKSKSFTKLLEECVLPPLKKRLLLASPEDARHRDECSLIFSLETLFSIESVEKTMVALFKADQRNMQRYLDENGDAAAAGQELFEDPIVAALARIKIIPQIVSEHEVMQLIADILPSIHSNKTLSTSNMWIEMKFPQWQWVICVIAFKAVTFSIQKGQAEGKIKVR